MNKDKEVILFSFGGKEYEILARDASFPTPTLILLPDGTLLRTLGSWEDDTFFQQLEPRPYLRARLVPNNKED